jgi:integrase
VCGAQAPFLLAVKGEKIHRAPHIVMLPERNIRTGFFEDHQYEAVRAHLPAYAQPVVTFAYLTGWRVRSEVLTLQWRQVDFKAGIIRLDPGTTKNLEGRVFVTPELRATLEAQRTVTEAKQQKTGSITPWVFHRTKRGRPLKSFRKAWQQACTAAGVPGRILHDFQTDGGEEPRTRRHPALRGHEDGRPQDRERLSPLRDRRRGDTPRRRSEARRASRAKSWAKWRGGHRAGVVEGREKTGGQGRD